MLIKSCSTTHRSSETRPPRSAHIQRATMSHHQPTRKSSLCSLGGNCTSFLSDPHHHSRMSKLLHLHGHAPTHHTHLQPHLFPTVDVPDHAHYIIGSVILLVGVTGMLGNALVIYMFCCSRTLRSPSNLLVVNLAAADVLMSLTQSPVFFVSSLRCRWVFWELACELYAFCGALFGITSMITLTAIAVGRCLAITRPLALLGGVSRGRVWAVLMGVWLYSLGWSLPPFFGWSVYVPEGLQTSCSWDYMSFTTTVRTYTILLFAFVFFVPLCLIASCYFAIFQAVRQASQEVEQLDCGETNKAYVRLCSEWRLAKVALGMILLFVVSWSPYSAVALTATVGYAHLLTPYMNSVPAVIAKASAIHNPIIYAITHPKYRTAIGRHVPLLCPLLQLQEKDLRSSFSSSSASSRQATLTGLSSPGVRLSAGARAISRWRKNRLSSASDSESCWMESEADGSSAGSAAITRQASTDVTADNTAAPNTNPDIATSISDTAIAATVLSQQRGQTGADLPDGGAAAERKPLLLSL